MPAQSGNAILLSYGPQGTQQEGSAILLASGVEVPASRQVTSRTRAPWRRSAAMAHTLQAAHAVTSACGRSKASPWPASRAQDANLQGVPWIVSRATDDAARAPWGRYERYLQPENLMPWRASRPGDDTARVPWGRYERRVQPETDTAWWASRPADDAAHAPWGRYERRIAQDMHAVHARAAPADRVRFVPWVKFSRQLGAGWGIVTPIHEGPPEALFIVPIKEVYVQTNITSLRRVEGDILLPASRLNLRMDRNSWVWSFDASMPVSVLPYLQPDASGEPYELEAMVNGTAFRFLAEKVGKDRQFGSNAVRVSGRGRAAYLDRPHAAVMSFNYASAMTAEQLANAVMTVNETPLGWEIAWQAVDWLVPGGLFSHNGTHASALNEIAASAGSYVQAHPSDDILAVLPHYPVLPRDWATTDPDYDLPAQAMTRESIDWNIRPRYNRVFVRGEHVGVSGDVRMAGTAGDILAPMVVDRLITTAAAARQRATPILADTGVVADVSLRLPVYTESGIIMPGKLVRYTDGADVKFGLTRSVSLEVGHPDVWQTIGVETHVL